MQAGRRPPIEAIERAGAFAVRRGAEVFGLRDPLGASPFYYAPVAGTLKASAKLAEVVGEGEPVLDEREVARFLIGRGVRRDATLAAHVRKLPAGHWMQADAAGGVKIARYWRPEETKPREISLADAAAEVYPVVRYERVWGCGGVGCGVWGPRPACLMMLRLLTGTHRSSASFHRPIIRLVTDRN